MLSILDRERTVAGPGYRPAFSVFKEPLVEHFGTKLTPISVIFSIAIVMLGLSAAVGGTLRRRLRHRPGHLKDLFGTLEVGAIHGRLLTAWSAAGVAGPLIINAIEDSEAAAGKSGADLYTLSLHIMVGVLIVGFAASLLIRPVADRHMEPGEEGSGRFRREWAPAEQAVTAERS